MGCAYEQKRLAGTDCVGCTCDRKQFCRIIVFLALLYVFLYLSARRSHTTSFAERVCQEGISPTVSGSCGKDAPIAHTHLAMVPNAVAERVLNRLFRMSLYQ